MKIDSFHSFQQLKFNTKYHLNFIKFHYQVEISFAYTMYFYRTIYLIKWRVVTSLTYIKSYGAREIDCFPSL